MKLNKKGFTLIELLAIITVLAVVSSITANIIVDSIANAKENSIELTKSNIAKQAINYISEGFTSKYWMKDINGEEYQCVTVGQLVDAGYFTKKIYEDNPDLIYPELYIKVLRDNNTKAIKEQTLYTKDENGSNSQGESACPYSTVTCVYTKPTGWEPKVEVTLNYNITGNDNTNGITDNFQLFSGLTMEAIPAEIEYFDEENNRYYRTHQNGNINITATSSGTILADTRYENQNVMSSTTCSISNIDGNGPLAHIESETMWANREKIINLKLKVNDDKSGVKELEEDKLKEKLEVYVSNGYDDNATYSSAQTGKLTSISKNNDEYNLTLTGITGDGKLKVKINADAFYDNANNPNTAQEFETDIKIDNTEPYHPWSNCAKDGVTDPKCDGLYWTNNSFMLFITNNGFMVNGEGYGIANNDYGVGSPYTKIYVGNGSESTKDKVSQFIWQDFYQNRFIYNQSDDAYIYVMDEAGNINTNGYGNNPGINPYYIKIDKIPPTVSIAKSPQTGNITKLECSFSDNGGSGLDKYYFGISNSSNEYTYTNYTGTNNKTINNPSNGEYICIAYDKAGNMSSTISTVNNGATYINVSLNAKIGNNAYNGAWTNQDITLIGTYQTDGQVKKYAFTNSATPPADTSTSWTTISPSTSGTQTKTLTTEGEEEWYFHVIYDNNQNAKSTKLTTKLDKTKPTCGNKSFSDNNSESGVSGSIACIDDLSLCTQKSVSFSNKKQSITLNISDYAGNTNTCSVTIVGKKKKCKTYKEICQISEYADNHLKCKLVDNYGTFIGYGLIGVTNSQRTFTIKNLSSNSTKLCKMETQVKANISAVYFCPSGGSIVYSTLVDVVNYTSHKSWACQEYNASVTNNSSCTYSNEPEYKCIFIGS